MATRSKQAFMLPDEFIDCITEVKMGLGLEVLVQYRNEPPQVWDGELATALRASRVFLADARTFDTAVLADDTTPARLGWVLSDVPGVDGEQLFSIQLAARSDWFDKKAEVVRESKEGLKLFDKVWKIILPRLSFPVVAKNLVTGAQASYPSIGYSAGVATWAARKGKLRQRGVENIEFSIPSAHLATQ